MAIDNRDGHIYVKELESDTIIRIDPLTGNRTIVSGDGTGTGDDFNGLSGLSVDTMKDRILAISSSSLISVNLQSGDRNTITSFPDIGSLSLATYTTINNESSKVYIVDLFKGIVEFDLETEVARIVSSDEVGSGPELNEPTHIAVDRKNNRLFVEDYNDKANEDDPINVELLVVDIETGNRIQLLSLFEQEYEQMALTPAVDQANDLLYISMPNRGVAIFDVETKQYLMISQ
ncbi:hypothetical protein QT397_03120 [Microbulbifer sp. MKSA007]|nr:hypothetical protein QT397_03120 [Microbulbifer sp. MKSA007]